MPSRVGEHWIIDVTLAPPELSDNRADADRLRAALGKRLGTDDVAMDLDLLRTVPGLLRSWAWTARCTLFHDRRWRLLGLSDPASAAPVVGAALDLGTTRMALRLVDLGSGETLTESSFDNPQVAVGPDVLTRIHHADRPGGRRALQDLVIDGLRRELAALCRSHGLDPGAIPLLTVAGNTTMTHLFLGLDPRWIIREPYIPAVNRPGLLCARDLGLPLAPGAGVFVFPNIGSYFGGDLIAGILASGLHQRNEPAVLVDVGTNAEVVIGGCDWLLGCAGAAGPALEGGAASMGMTAAPGAIDRVSLVPVSGALEVRTIGDEPAVGICGSGLIDLVACLFRSRRIDRQGRFVPEVCGEDLRDDDGARSLVVVPGAASATGEDLCVSQPEVDSLVRSKAAMFTILETIAAAVGMRPEDFGTYYVAGTFGAYIDPASAITIGMLPDLPSDAYRRLGNSSLAGATLVLTSPQVVDDIDRIRDSITYLELNVNQDFMNRFSAARFLPHTDLARFPSVEVPG